MIVLYTTLDDLESLKDIASTLLEENLIACANIRSMHTALYRREGEIKEEQEFSAILKTSKEKAEEAKERLLSLHTYEVPCVFSFEATAGHMPFLDWIETELS